MAKIDFVNGTVTPGMDFVKMTPDQLADKLAEGVPADNLHQLAFDLADDAAGQRLLNKYTAVVLKLAAKAAASGTGGLTNLIAGYTS
jgi:hypothetical protein